ncbi:MAG: multiprotein bridging factor aMBF1 [Nitrososphaerales archaeon]
MAERCEVCGNPIRGPVNTIQVDGGIFRVCPLCSRLGKPVKMPGDPRPPPPIISRSKPSQINTPYQEQELELRRDFNTLIKSAREKKGLSQEEFGRRINEKLSVIKHLETGSLKPNDVLTRKVEHFLKIRLLIPEEVEE